MNKVAVGVEAAAVGAAAAVVAAAVAVVATTAIHAIKAWSTTW